MQFPEAYAYLLKLPRWEQKGVGAYHPGLAVIDGLLAAMGRPQDAFRSVLVAGTNGKGTTASFIAAACSAAGLKTGLHTSPHLTDFSERMRVDGSPAPHDWIAGAVSSHQRDFDRLQPTFFEASVALSLKYFADEGVHVAVVEVGLGGRLDATNILDAECSVITRIGYDHTEILGKTLDVIAAEKAGIIKEGRPVVMAAQDSAAAEAVRRRAAQISAPVLEAGKEVRFEVMSRGADATTVAAETPAARYDPLVIGLPGDHQLENAAAALRAAEMLLPATADRARAITGGFSGVRKLTGLQGRCEVIQRSPHIIVDVAHNAEGIQAALAYARSLAGKEGGITVLLGLMRDKDAREIGRVLAGNVNDVMVVGGFAERACSTEELAEMLADTGLDVSGVQGAHEALERFRQSTKNGVLLATGSHLVVSMVKRLFDTAASNMITS